MDPLLRNRPAWKSVAALFACWLGLVGICFGQATINSYGVTYTAPGYVIGADAAGGGADRHEIDVTATINFTVNSSYRVEWALLNPAGIVMATSQTVLGANVIGIRNPAGVLEPTAASPLLPGVLYRLRVNVRDTVSGNVVATATEAPGHTYIHFPGTAPTTAPRNIISEVTSVTVDRHYLLETNANRTTIPVTVGYTLHRYDDWIAAASSQNIIFNFTPVLLRQGDNQVQAATVTDNQSSVSLATHGTGGGISIPATASGTVTLQMDPAAILAPNQYHVSVQIAHIEQASSTIKTGTTLATADAWFYHFTGALSFGGIATHFSQLANPPSQYNPPAPNPGVQVNLRLTVALGAGLLDGRGDHKWSQEDVMNVILDASGNATWQNTSGIFTSNPQVLTANTAAAAEGTLNGVTFTRGTITMDGSGARAGVEVTLPTGIGWAADRKGNLLDNVVDFGVEALNQNLEPSNPAPLLVKAPGTFFLCEETKPLYIEALALQWTTATGEFSCGALAGAHSIRQPLLDYLTFHAANYLDPAMAEKMSNDFLYNKVNLAGNVRFQTGISGGGELSASFTSTAGAFKSHFPYGGDIKWNAASLITVAADLINTTPSVLNNASNIVLQYGRHCQDAVNRNCGPPEYSTLTVSPNATQLKLTPDGGISAAGPVTMSLLSWGRTDTNQYAHQIVSAFPSADFLMSGSFLRGDLNPLGDNDGPSVLLLSGVDPATLTVTERPAAAGYSNGNANYAGVNFRTTGTADGLSRLNDSPFGNYDLTARSKYYARYSGVTGIHEAPAGGFPGSAMIADYQFTISTFGLSFLSNEIDESRISGQLDLPSPTDFTLSFNELLFDCLGALTSAQLDPTDNEQKEFAYWSAAFTPYAVNFESTNACNPGDGSTLVLGFGAHASHLGAITGSLGILPTGYFARAIDALPADVPTRITLPGALTLTGSQGETYAFFPTQGAYLNHSSGLPAGEGFWSLFGTLDVPFFRNVEINTHLKCEKDDLFSTLYFMGGWPDHGWLESGSTPFDSAVFDDNHTGYSGADLGDYRDGNTETGQNLPRAQQSWLGVVDFDYPLVWNTIGFNFTGTGPVSHEFIVVETEHELDYLDAKTAHLHFGATYDGLPEISVKDIVFTALDDATSAASAFVQDGADRKIFNAIEDAVDASARVLSDEIENLIGKAVRDLTDPIIEDFTTAVADELEDGVWTQPQLQALIDTRLRAPAGALATELKKLGTPDLGNNRMLQDLDAELAEIEQGIDALANTATVDPDSGATLTPAIDGLLLKTGGTRPGLSALARAMVDTMSDKVSSGSVTLELDAALADRDSTLTASVATLNKIKSDIQTLRTELQSSPGFGAELADLAAGAAVELESVAASTADRAEELVLDFAAEELDGLALLTEEWQAELSEAVMDAIASTGLSAALQTAVKEHLYDLQGAFNSAVDAAFAALNAAIKNALRGALTDIDDTLESFLGPVREVVKRGALTGFAHITGDSMKTIRIDGLLVLCVPDEMKLEGYIEIREMDSNGPNGCVGISEKLTEIEVGSPSVRLLSLSPECGLGEDVRAALSLKCALLEVLDTSTTDPTDKKIDLNGIGGSFELVEGTIDFETFQVYEIGASVMMGADENYLAAKVGMRFGETQVAGGLFLGRACTRDPLRMVDPLVDEVLTMDTFTGIYGYGEATIPVFGTGTCFFNISAKVGAGAFYFVEGPTFGGRMTLGVYGKALCAVEVGGEVSLAGAKSGKDYNFAGYGRVFGAAGVKPFRVEANFKVDFNYSTATDKFEVDF